MATNSNILAWEIPWTKEPGGPQYMGSQRAGNNLATEQQQWSRILGGLPWIDPSLCFSSPLKDLGKGVPQGCILTP